MRRAWLVAPYLVGYVVGRAVGFQLAIAHCVSQALGDEALKQTYLAFAAQHYRDDLDGPREAM